ncbi:hypothetical protein FPG78_03575 [Cardinium endosymbiont of Dermatophagoides farinae]|nr:hypothetical protein FPG78_03575 [Cardinium endosymbiont of Dermatophagoides farinae]
MQNIVLFMYTPLGAVVQCYKLKKIDKEDARTMIEILLQHKDIDPTKENIDIDGDRTDPLSDLIMNNCNDLIDYNDLIDPFLEYFKDKKFDINTPNSKVRFYLYIAVDSNNIIAVKKILNKFPNVDLTLKDADGKALIDRSKELRDPAIYNIFLEHVNKFGE